MVVAVVVLLMTSGLLVHGQTQDGPYYVVDPSPGAVTWGHVFGTIGAALTAIKTNPVEEMVGTTIVLYPGDHSVANPVVVDVPNLRIVSRDGADRTMLHATVPNAPLFSITAPGVHMADITITADGLAGVVGVQIVARDCVLERVVAQDLTGAAGIVANTGADSLRLLDCASVRNPIGLQAQGVWDLHVEGGQFSRSAPSHGIQLRNSRQVTITSTTISGNAVNGIGLTNCTDVDVDNCDLSANGIGIGNVAPSSPIRRLDVHGCTLSGNAGFAIALTNLFQSAITENSFSNNAAQAVAISGPASDVTVSQNTVSAPGLAFPAPAISLTGGITSSTVSDNSITGYQFGIGLLAGLNPPSSNSISGNHIFDVSGDGIIVRASGGMNTFAENRLDSCDGVGIRVDACTEDLYIRNEISSCTQQGILVNDATSPIAALTVQDNAVSECGMDGICLNAIVNGNGMGNVLLVANKVLRSDKSGISAITGEPGIAGLRVEGNVIRGNEGDGFSSTGVGVNNLIIHGNEIVANLGFGLNVTDAGTRVTSNIVHENAAGGLNLTFGRAGPPVVEQNSFYANQNFGCRLNGAPAAPLYLLPYPYGFSLAANWWGHETGPAGLSAGAGSALLGVPTGSEAAVAPLLPAPLTYGLAPDSGVLSNAQVSLIPTFAATQVKIDRMDTAGVRVLLNEVTPRANGWVSTASYDIDWLGGLKPLPGTLVRAIAVMAAGFDSGVAELALDYSDAMTGGLTADQLSVYVCEGGEWVFDQVALQWTLEGSSWTPVPSCPVPGSSVLTVELAVESLNGDIKAIALFAEGTPSGSSE